MQKPTKKQKIKSVDNLQKEILPVVNYHIDRSIIKKIIDHDLEKIKNIFDVDIVEEKTKFTITSKSDISLCRNACNALEKMCKLIDSGVILCDDDIDDIISNLLPIPYKESKYKSFFRTYKNEDISPRTENQENIIDSIKYNDITIISGKSGTGKTKISLCVALKLLWDFRYDSIKIIRPTTTIGSTLGYVPGSLEEKYSVYCNPIIENLIELIGEKEYENMITSKKLIFVPLSYIRGSTISNSLIFLDEAQNLTIHETLSLLTRFGNNSKFIITGDIDQKDIKTNKTEMSGLEFMIERLQDIEDVGFVKMTEKDIQRHKLVGEIIRAFE